MRAKEPLTLLGSVRSELVKSVVAEIERNVITGVSVVPGFSRGRAVRGLRATPKPPRDKFWFDADLIQCVDTPIYSKWPAARSLVEEIMEMTGSTEVGMVTLASMEPGATISPHNDLGDYYSYYHRLHVALKTNDDAWLFSAEQRVNCKPGEIWELDNLLQHYARNDGQTNRVHLIVDVA